MSLLALLSRSVIGHRNPNNLSIIQYILHQTGIVNNFNNFQHPYSPQFQLNPCLITNQNLNLNELYPSNILDILSSGTFYGYGKLNAMERWNRRLKQHGLACTLSRKTKYAGHRVMMWIKLRPLSRHKRGIQIPKKRHKQ